MTTLRTPPLLLGAALLFWGWHSGLMLVGALLAVAIESSRVVGLRWDLSEKDFGRLWDFSATLCVAVIIYLFAANEGASAVAGFINGDAAGAQTKVIQQTGQAMLILFRWMPMIFALFVAAQAYSTRPVLPWSVFSYVMRRKQARGLLAPAPAGSGVNMAWAYFGISLTAACITVRGEERDWFYAGLAALVGWALWFQRPPRFAVGTWAGLLALVLAGGFFGQRGFYELTSWANGYSANWLANFIHAGSDPRESRTAIGAIGRLKLSGRIVLRVEPKDNHPVPPLLREASYRYFKTPDWAGAGKAKDFEHVPFETNLTTWEFAARGPAQSAVTLAQYLTGRGQDARRGLLAVPQGIVRMERLGAFQVTTNRLGVVRVDEGPGLVIYDAFFRDGSTIDAPPDRDDRAVPTNEKAVCAEIVGELGLAGQPTNEILRRVAGFFRDHFAYSTWLPGTPRGGGTNQSPLTRFLRQDRQGHCEYFATAATLLLREAGVPARYAVGYSVQEKSGHKFVVRERHAHAWCLAWVNGAWRDFDVTPGSWVGAEDARAPWYEALTDGWSRLWFEVSKWRWGFTDWRKYLLWIFGPALAVMLVRLLFGKKWRRFRAEQKRQAAAVLYPGLDSEFYLLETELARRGLVRPRHETLLDWLDRVQASPALAPLREPLTPILRLHYRYRFDPAGLGAADRAELAEGVRSCLERLRER